MICLSFLGFLLSERTSGVSPVIFNRMMMKAFLTKQGYYCEAPSCWHMNRIIHILQGFSPAQHCWQQLRTDWLTSWLLETSRRRRRRSSRRRRSRRRRRQCRRRGRQDHWSEAPNQGNTQSFKYQIHLPDCQIPCLKYNICNLKYQIHWPAESLNQGNTQYSKIPNTLSPISNTPSHIPNMPSQIPKIWLA